MAESTAAVLERLGLSVSVGSGQGCDASLLVEGDLNALMEDYAGAGICYTGAEFIGEATLTKPGEMPMSLPLSARMPPEHVITECPRSAAEAPVDYVWPQCIVDMLGLWWGVPALVAAIQVGEPLQDEAAWELGAMGPEAASAVPPLVSLLEQGDAGARSRAAMALGFVGHTAAEAIPALVAAVSDQDYGVRVAAVQALGEVGNRVPSDALAEMPSEAAAALVGVLEGDDAWLREQAAVSLGLIRSGAAVAALEVATGDEDRYVASAAIRSLGDIGAAATEAVPTLIGLLASQDETAQEDAAAALEAITGEALGKDVEAWQHWWEAHG